MASIEQAKRASEHVNTRCCIVGGGPAGMVAGYLLARAGVDVVVLEKHADFLRDFRGDTIHPSTLELMYELGILREFLRQPHQELPTIGGQIEDHTVTVADFSRLPTHSKFIALMPQWDFLNFIAEQAHRYPRFRLRMEFEVTELLEEEGRIVGVRARTPQGVVEVHAALTLGADGRHSLVRREAGLEVVELGAPIDVLWMRLRRDPSDPVQTLGRFRRGKILVTLNRGDYWQCAYVIRKGTFDAIRQQGLPAFRESIASMAPFLGERAQELSDWNEIRLLTVVVDRLRRWWRPGLLCIGDSAHAMSPVGGVGINLAIQDAVAAVNTLFRPLQDGTVSDEHLRQIQKRREYPTRMTQRVQIFAHQRFFRAALNTESPRHQLPLLLRLLQQFPALRRIPARMIGLGFRPEHVLTPDTQSGTPAEDTKP